MIQGMTSVRVNGSVVEAVTALHAALNRRGVHVFASIDHAGGARAAGLELRDEVVVLFGDPGVGTALMQDQPDVGYDLPLRVLLRDDDGTTTFTYRDPHLLIDEYGLSSAAPTVAKLSGLLEQLANELSRPA